MYATVEDVQKGFRELSENEMATCEDLLDESGFVIDAYCSSADLEIKRRVSIRMVRRALGDGEISSFPMGATQGSVSALGYSQSWTIGSGSVGEIYLNRTEKKLLGVGAKIGMVSSLEGMEDD